MNLACHVFRHGPHLRVRILAGARIAEIDIVDIAAGAVGQ
jgi:hypothetical protein